jgi:hypothetical protein
MTEERNYTAFSDSKCLATGPLTVVLKKTKAWLDREEDARLLIFDDETGRQVEFDFSGTLEEVLRRVAPPEGAAKPGRPRLGVIGREVSLLPRHWEWLEEQPNGISATLRRLVDEARKREPGKQKARAARDAANRFMTAMAGNLPGYEEACRALYAGDAEGFSCETRAWPNDVRKHALRWVHDAARFENEDASST